jgi:ketosteroid isomerase-like protein
MERIDEILGTHDKRLSEHGRQIDLLMERDGEKDKRLALMAKDIESTNDAVKRVERTMDKIDGKLDKALETRTDDHLMKPLSDYRKIAWIVISAMVMFLFGVLVSRLFPGA